MRTETIKIFQYSELSKEAKEKARKWYLDGDNTPFLTENIEESIKEDLEEKDIKIIKNFEVHYSLSNSQGDGVMFEGLFLFKGVHFRVKHYGHYYHGNSKTIESLRDDDKEIPPKLDEEFNNLYVEICKKAEKVGYAEIEYQESEEAIAETMEANEDDFLEDGTRW